MPDPLFNDRTSPLALLRSRRSGKARDLVAPGPAPDQLAGLLQAAMRVPDHGKLAPWRFVEIVDRAAFAALLQRLYTAEKGAAGRLEAKALDDFAHQAPCLVAVLSLIADSSRIPAWEQQMSAGAATYNLLLAAHAAGFAANWLTEPAAYLPGIADALGHPGARVAGFVFIGTPGKPLEERPRPDYATIVSRWPAG